MIVIALFQVIFNSLRLTISTLESQPPPWSVVLGVSCIACSFLASPTHHAAAAISDPYTISYSHHKPDRTYLYLHHQ